MTLKSNLQRSYCNGHVGIPDHVGVVISAFKVAHKHGAMGEHEDEHIYLCRGIGSLHPLRRCLVVFPAPAWISNRLPVIVYRWALQAVEHIIRSAATCLAPST